MDDNKLWVFISFTLLICLIGFLAGSIVMKDKYRGQAIEHNCAEYDLKTGEWGWK